MAKAFLGDFAQYLRRLFPGYDNDARTDGELLERFVKRRDEDAFLSLVQRHGPMVLRTCQRILGERHLAEDSFQATFIVLARRAAAIRSRPSLSTWLHAVAQRVANKARAKTSLQRNRERQLGHMARAAHLDEHTWQELSSVLDEEMSRLAEKYRAPLVLCYLQNKSQEKAANELGVAKGTLARRLARGRALLRQQLIKRGITLSAAALATALCERVGGAPLSAMLTVNTAKAAASVLAGKALIGGGAAALAWQLADEALVGMAGVKAKLIVLTLVVGSVLGGAGWAGYGAFEEKARPAAEAQALQPAPNQGKGESQKQKPPVAVDRYGDPLPDGALARIGTVRYRHPDYISFLALAPDGDFIVSQARDGIRVWDTKTGKELRHFPHLVGDLSRACDLSPGGKLIASQGKNDDLFALWDIESGRKVRDLGVVREGNLARFSPDGKYLLTHGSDGDSMATLWDVPTGKAVRSWSPHERFFFSATFTGDGKTLITAISGQVCCWDLATGMKTREFSNESKAMSSIAASPDGKLLATVGTIVTSGGGNSFSSRPENTIRIWDIALGKEVRTINVPENKDSPFPASVSNFRFTPDGKRIVTSGMSSALRFWDVATGKELQHIPLDCYGSGHLAFSRDGKKLATAAAMLTIRLFDLASGKDLAPPGEHQMELVGLAFSASGRNLAIVSDQAINVWDPITGQLRFQMHGAKHTNNTGICLTRDGRTLYSAGLYKGIHAFDMETGKKLREYENVPLSGAASLALAPDGATMAVANEKSVVLLDTRTGRKLQEFTGNEPGAVAFCAGGKKLMGWSGDETFNMWDLTTGKRSADYPFPKDIGPLRMIAMTPDSRLIALAGRKKDLLVIDMEMGRELAYAVDLADAPCFGAFAPDGRTLAWAGWTEAPVRLMEIASGKERRRFLGHKGRVGALAYSADGGMLASGGVDTTALVWDLLGKNAKKTSLLTDQDIRMCWNDLAGEDAGRAYQSIKKLARDPAHSIPFLNRRLQMVQPVDQKRLTALIRDIGSDVFADREKATRELVSLDRIATSACVKALKNPPSLEVRRRLEAVLEKHKQRLRNPSPDFLRNLRALETIELAGTPDAYEVLTRMSKGASESRLTMDAKAALQRLTTRKALNSRQTFSPPPNASQ